MNFYLRKLTFFTLILVLWACSSQSTSVRDIEEPTANAVCPTYNRDLYNHWIDADGDCQDTRQEVLNEENLVGQSDSCRITSGGWYAAYSGATITDPSGLDIDHFVPLAETHRSGAGLWSDSMKTAYANGVLISSLSGGVGQMSADLAGKLQKAGLMGFVITVFKVYYRIREYLRGLWEAFSSSFSAIRSTLEPVVTGLVGAFGNILETFGIISSAADASSFNSFGAVLGSFLGTLAQVGAYLVRFLFMPLTIAVKLIAWVTKGITGFVKTTAEGFVIAGKWAAKFLLPVRMVISLIETIGQVVKTAFDVFSGNITAVQGLQNIGSAVLNYVLTPFYWAKDAISGVFGFIQGLFMSVGQFFISIGNSILDGFMNLPLVGTLRSVFNGVSDFLNGELLGSLFESGKKVLSTFADGVKATVMAPVNAIKSGLGKIREFLPFSDAKIGPLSTLTASGQALLGTIAGGMEKAEDVPAQAMEGSASGIMQMFSQLWTALTQGAGVAATDVSAALGSVDGSIQSHINPPKVVPSNGLFSGITQNIQGVLNLAPKLNGVLIPKMLQAALALTPVMAGELPALSSSLPISTSEIRQDYSQNTPVPFGKEPANTSAKPFEPVPSPIRASQDYRSAIHRFEYRRVFCNS